MTHWNVSFSIRQCRLGPNWLPDPLFLDIYIDIYIYILQLSAVLCIFNWWHHPFYRRCSRAVARRRQTLALLFLSYSPSILPLLRLAPSTPPLPPPTPVPRPPSPELKGYTTWQRLSSETRHSSFSLGSWDHFLKVTAQTCVSTWVTHSCKWWHPATSGGGGEWSEWGGEW